MAQQSIASYFGQRKRKLGTEEITAGNKVLILEQSDANVADDIKREINTPTRAVTKTIKLISNKKESAFLESRIHESKTLKPRGKAIVKLSFENVKSNGVASPPSSPKSTSQQIETKNPDGTSSGKNVLFKKLGTLSPKKNSKASRSDITAFMMKESAPNLPLDVAPKEISTNSINKVALARKELSLGEIKKRLTGSSRINELRASINKLSKGYDQLKQLQAPVTAEKSLEAFKSIEVLVPMSPVKQSPSKVLSSPLTSPLKEPLMSPRKEGQSPLTSPVKVPAYKRLASLATPTPSLTLPHHYRWLGEVFRSIETVCSMLHNRKESITYSKIKPAVQEMLRRNITEKQLGQIKHLCPQMYKFEQQKIKNFGATSKRDEYDLVLIPILVNQKTGEPSSLMTPDIILERRRSFFNLLMETVKNHHATFLMSLDPPMDIPKEKLKRWHPEFDLEKIPDPETDPLPEPPNVEKYCTAQDVLSHIRDKISCNTRMERALIKLAEAKARGLTAEEMKVTGLTDDVASVSSGSSVSTNDSSQQTDSDAASSSTYVLKNPALKGISKALLDKVRAKQAAKALQSMTRSPAQERNSMIYQRLPELARLVRNLYVTEKKSALALELVVSKLDNCFRTKISNAEITENLRLLSKHVPGWLTFYEFGKVEYLKIVKDSDINKIIKSLEELARKHYV